jgi:hypothetical protein
VIHEEKQEPMADWARNLLTLLAVLIAIACARSAFAEEGNCREQVWYAAQKAQPWFHGTRDAVAMTRRTQHLRDFTLATCAETAANNVPPLLAVAIAFRESSIMPHVGLGKKNGERGEQGYYQVMPGGEAERYVSRDCPQSNPACNAKSAMAYLAHKRETCENGESPWVYVGAYGRGRCPDSIEDAKTWPEVQRARRIFCQLDEGCAATWPE